MKEQYRKQAREAAKQGKKAVRFTEKVVWTVIAFVKSSPGVMLLDLVLFLLTMILQSCVTGVTTTGNRLVSIVGGTSYGSSDNDTETVEKSYTELEKDLWERLSQIERNYPNYDEYRYSVDEIGHGPFKLASYLTAKYGGYTPTQVQAELRALLGQQYILTITETVEVRYHTETDTWMDGDGKTHTDTYEVPYDYYTLNVSLKNRSLGTAALANFDPEQTECYLIYQKTKGSRPYFSEGNIYVHPDEYTNYDTPPETLADPEFAALIAEAEKCLGYPYVWGGTSPSTFFDCSGFVCYVLDQSNVYPVSRTTVQGVSNQCAKIPRSGARPGDIIFFTGTYDNSGPVSHVGIYVGRSMMLHCTSGGVQYARMNTNYWAEHFYAMGRLQAHFERSGFLNVKIERINKDVQKTKEKINEFRMKPRELEKQKTELENLEIVGAVHGVDISLTDLADLLKAAKAGSTTSGQFGPKSTVHNESREEGIEE